MSETPPSPMPGLHLIVGAGVIGRATAQALRAAGHHAVLASRNPPPAIGQAPPHQRLDALDGAAWHTAARGASHLYLTLGLAYHAATWERDWPRIMRNAIDAATAQGARLVWFDNLYAYGPLPLRVPMREDHPVAPPSRKGLVRARLLRMLHDAGQERGLRWLVARSADFYGPAAQMSVLYLSGIRRQLQGRTAWWLGDADRPHSFTYTDDAGRAMALLALQTDTWRQSWHLPTAGPAPTPRALLAESARLLRVSPTVRSIPLSVVRLLGLAVPIMRELAEMGYQYEQDYIFDSSRFMARFPDFAVTPYTDGMAATVTFFQNARRGCADASAGEP